MWEKTRHGEPGGDKTGTAGLSQTQGGGGPGARDPELQLAGHRE